MSLIKKIQSNKKLQIFIAFALGAVALLIIGFLTSKTDTLYSIRATVLLNNCKNVANDDSKIDCVYAVMENEVLRAGPYAGMRIVSAAYASHFLKEPIFHEDGCHRMMHFLGDFAYFNLYLPTKDISVIDFSPPMLACDFGFSHAVMGHLIQDNPTPEFLEEMCENLKSRYARKVNIGYVCYLSAGHGLLYAQAEQVSKNQFGNFNIFFETPMTQCEALLSANDEERRACKIGVSGALLRFMQEDVEGHGKEGYKFSLNTEDPFLICQGLRSGTYEICNKTMANLLYITYTASEKNLFSVIDKIQLVGGDWQLKKDMIYDAFKNIVYLEHEAENKYQRLLAECQSFEQRIYEACIEGIVGALYAFGLPEWAYEKPILFCSNQTIQEQGARSFCYEKVVRKMPMFVRPEYRAGVCKKFPKDIQKMCLDTI